MSWSYSVHKKKQDFPCQTLACYYLTNNMWYVCIIVIPLKSDIETNIGLVFRNGDTRCEKIRTNEIDNYAPIIFEDSIRQTRTAAPNSSSTRKQAKSELYIVPSKKSYPSYPYKMPAIIPWLFFRTQKSSSRRPPHTQTHTCKSESFRDESNSSYRHTAKAIRSGFGSFHPTIQLPSPNHLVIFISFPH